VLVTSGLSKAFGLPGLRIGWIVGPPRMVEKLWSYHDYTTIAPGMLSDFLARRVMEPGRRDAIFERTRGIVRRNWPVLEQWIGDRGDYLSVIPPVAGAIAFVRYNLPMASIRLCERLRVEKSVLIVPGDQLGTPRHVRFGFGYGDDATHMAAGLERIDSLFSDLRAKSQLRAKKVVRSRRGVKLASRAVGTGKNGPSRVRMAASPRVPAR
jgi:aspartate/methionine/tyrosine aminotransferase